MSPRGWALVRAGGLALAVVLLSPLSPVVVVLLPVAVLLAAFHHRRPVALAVAAAIVWMAFASAPPDPGPLWYASRAWALILGGVFVGASVLLPGMRVLTRAIAAVAGAFALVAFSGLVRPGLLAELDWWVGQELARAARAATAMVGGPDLWERLGTSASGIVDVQVMLYPGLLALASLAALGVAWFVVARFEGGLEPLAPLREFVFSDQLVWVLVGGLLLFLLPLGELGARVGENAVLFMGGLYLLRGLGILVWLAAGAIGSAWTAALWGLAALLFYPVIVGAALLMGLSDTWLHLRERLARASRDR